MKKILIHNYIFEGGAPKSTYEYAKLLNDYYDVYVIGEFSGHQNEHVEKLKDLNIEVYNLEAFQYRKIVKNFFLLLDYFKKIKKIQPDLIISATFYNYFFDNIIFKLKNIPVLYLFAAGTLSAPMGSTLSKVLSEDEELIVFSYELFKILEKKLNNKIHLLPNRMSFNEKAHSKESIIANKSHKNIRFLLVSRLSEMKIKSVEYVIALVNSLMDYDLNIQLTILGDGDKYEEIKNSINTINKNYNKNLIFLEGYKTNVQDYIKSSDIVFGKGRSVLEGVFDKKLAIVVNESGHSYLVSKDNFIELMKFNFTGRNYRELKKHALSKEDYLRIIRDIEQKESILNLEELANYAKSQYDILEVKDKIIYIINKNINRRKKTSTTNTIKIFYEYIKLYAKILINIIKDKFFFKS